MAFHLAQVNIARLVAPLESPELADFVAALDPVNAVADRAVLRRHRRWFEQMEDAYTACWWVPTGHEPTADEAEDRVRHLRRRGPSPYAFTLREHFPAPTEN